MVLRLGISRACANWILPLLNKFTTHVIMEEQRSTAALHAGMIVGGPCFAALTAALVNTRTYFITVLIYQ